MQARMAYGAGRASDILFAGSRWPIAHISKKNRLVTALAARCRASCRSLSLLALCIGCCRSLPGSRRLRSRTGKRRSSPGTPMALARSRKKKNRLVTALAARCRTSCRSLSHLALCIGCCRSLPGSRRLRSRTGKRPSFRPALGKSQTQTPADSEVIVHGLLSNHN